VGEIYSFMFSAFSALLLLLLVSLITDHKSPRILTYDGSKDVVWFCVFELFQFSIQCGD